MSTEDKYEVANGLSKNLKIAAHFVTFTIRSLYGSAATALLTD